jgi:class 3 adenylate cyclase
VARGGGIIDDAELPAVELLDLGEHRLKGLPSKQRLFQLQVSGLPSKFPPPRTPEAEGRRPGVGTFISTDLAGSRRLIRELGDEASAALFAEYRKAVTTAVEAGNGVVLECSGDHAFAVFGSPSDALRAAAGVRQAVRSLSWQSDWDVPVEIIVHSGRWSGDPHEPAASTAFFRLVLLAKLVEPGQILVSQTTASLVEGDQSAPALRTIGERDLPELGETVRLYELGRTELGPISGIPSGGKWLPNAERSCLIRLSPARLRLRCWMARSSNSRHRFSAIPSD